MKKLGSFLLAVIMIFNVICTSIYPVYAKSMQDENIYMNSDDIKEDNYEKPEDGSTDESYEEELAEVGEREIFIDKEDNFNLIKPRSLKPNSPTRTYKFYVDSNEISSETQILTAENGILLEPATPQKENYVFLGRYIGDKRLVFEDGVAEIEATNLEKDEVIEVNAKFEEAYYVRFHIIRDGKDLIVGEKKGKSNEEISTSGILLPLLNNEYLEGRYKDSDFAGTAAGDNIKLETGNIDLYGKVVTGNFLSFDVGSYSYTQIKDQFIAPNDITNNPQITPERFGYNFKYRTADSTSKDTNGEYNGAKFEFGKSLDQNTKLYAVWEKSNTIKYNVVIYTELISDNKNTPLEERDYKTYTSTIEEIENDPDIDNLSEKIIDKYIENPKNITGFHLPIVMGLDYKNVLEYIPSDGFNPGTLHVFYSRDKVMIKFLDENSNLVKEFTGLYGQKLSKYDYSWPSEVYRETTDDDYKNRRVTFLDVFDIDSVQNVKISEDPVTGEKTQVVELKKDVSMAIDREVQEYKENLDGSYTLFLKVDAFNNFFSITDKFAGFHAYKYSKDNGEEVILDRTNDGKVDTTDDKNKITYNNILKIYNKRNEYKLIFDNHGEKVRTETLKFEESLKNYKDYKPERPKNIPESFVFDGRYNDKSFYDEVNFDEMIMPDEDVELYANRVPNLITLRVFRTLGAKEPIYQDNTLEYGSFLDLKSLPTVKQGDEVLYEGNNKDIIDIPKNNTWAGWYVKDKESGRYKKYDFMDKLVEDLDFYPYYYDENEVRVYYYRSKEDLDKKEVAFLSEPHSIGSDVMITDVSEGLKNEIGKKFIARTDGVNNYYNGSSVMLEKDLHLYPVWGKDLTKTKVVFKSGNGSEEDKVVEREYLINDKVNLPGEIDSNKINVYGVEFKGGENYIFKGWINSTDNKLYGPKDILLADNLNENEENILTAKWILSKPRTPLMPATPNESKKEEEPKVDPIDPRDDTDKPDEEETPEKEEPDKPDGEKTPEKEEPEKPDGEKTPEKEEPEKPDGEKTPEKEESGKSDGEKTPEKEEPEKPDGEKTPEKEEPEKPDGEKTPEKEVPKKPDREKDPAYVVPDKPNRENIPNSEEKPVNPKREENKQNTGKSTNKNKKLPQTGDGISRVLIAGIVGIAGSSLTFAGFRRKRKDEDKDNY